MINMFLEWNCLLLLLHTGRTLHRHHVCLKLFDSQYIIPPCRQTMLDMPTCNQMYKQHLCKVVGIWSGLLTVLSVSYLNNCASSLPHNRNVTSLQGSQRPSTINHTSKCCSQYLNEAISVLEKTDEKSVKAKFIQVLYAPLKPS